jgi:hypothetical protein
VMLDGLDEVAPEHNERVLAWICDLVKRYPRSRYVISARPAAYPTSLVRSLRLAVRDLCDFSADQVRDYAMKWSSAVGLLQNVPADEARRAGELEGDEIAKAVQANPYVENLAKNPLMLSTVCLVRYFEGGQFPDDRAVLYERCVEGLLHTWDQRRKIKSDFSLEEKLRVCRELAIAMQTDDKAEYPAAEVERVLSTIPGNATRTRQLFKHLIYRAGLFLERRPGVYGFVHLTFQEYMAATAIDEGNERGVDEKYLVANRGDQRWQEVLPLYMRVISAQSARRFLRRMIKQPDAPDLGRAIRDYWQAAKAEVRDDAALRAEVVTRVASAPVEWLTVTPLSRIFSWIRPRWPGLPSVLELWPAEEVGPIALRLVGTSSSDIGLSHAFGWLLGRPDVYETVVRSRLGEWRTLHPTALAELVCLAAVLGKAAFEEAPTGAGWEVLAAPGPAFRRDKFATQAELVILTITMPSNTIKRSRYLRGLVRLPWQVELLTQDEPGEHVSYIFTLLQAARVLDTYEPDELGAAAERLTPAFQLLLTDDHAPDRTSFRLGRRWRTPGRGGRTPGPRLVIGLPWIAELPTTVTASDELRELLEILDRIADRATSA